MAETISNPTEQRVTPKDGRTPAFTEYGDAKGGPFLEHTLMTSCVSCSRPVALKTQQLNGAQADVT